MNQKHLKLLCAEMQLGFPKEEPMRVFGSRGGSFMWRLNTEKGSYAIKQLAPIIDLKDEKIITKYELTETIAHRFAQQGISAVSALEKSGKHLIIIESTGYLVYLWVDGYTLAREEISETHALKIAGIQAKLHSINLSIPEVGEPRFDIYTSNSIEDMIDMAVSFKCPFSKILKENQSLILSMNDSYLAAIPLLKEGTVITHGDLDQLNILWDKAEQPILIDWESARRMNPTREIVRTSLGWSGIGTENFSLSLYTQMLRTYIKSGGMLNIKHLNAALYGVVGSLVFWMLYNIKLSCTSGVAEERDTAIKEVNGVLMMFIRLDLLIPDLLKIYK